MKTAADNKKWVLIISVGSGMIGGGSGVQYFVGDFDGRCFHADSTSPQFLDFGPDFYAFNSWNGTELIDGKRIGLGWMSNLKYSNDLPATNWRGQQSIPRKLNLKRDELGYYLAQQPIHEMKSLRFGSKEVLEQRIINQVPLEIPLPSFPIELGVEIRLKIATQVSLKISTIEDKSLTLIFDSKSETFFLDRRKAAYGDNQQNFAAVYEAPLSLVNGVISLHMFLDVCSIEIFGQNGRLTISSIFYLSPGQRMLTIFTKEEAHLEILNIWPLQAAQFINP